MNRCRTYVIADILETSLNEGAIQSDIIQRANLDFKQFKFYSEFLIERHLLEKICNGNTTYKTTQKGKNFLYHKKYIEKLLTPEK